MALKRILRGRMRDAALIEFDGVTKRFGKRTAVDALSFAVPEGSVVGLLGPNGAGKTTAIRVLLGLARATAGSASILGAAPGTRAFSAALREVGTLVEGPALYANASGRDNLRIQAAAIGLSDGHERIDEALALVGLAGRAGDAAKTYSLGMKQRLGLALALLARPRVVVLDEPTNGLDPAGIQEMRELIRSLPARGTTVLVSSHLLGEVQLMCDRVAIIHHGKLVADGTLDQVLAGAGGGARFEIVVAPQELEHARAALAAAGLAAAPAAGGAARLVVPADGRSGADVNRLLVEAGIYADELRRGAASLEDVFLEITGGATGDAS
jgi:ABC-2 type transport system ATP-binding protein